MNKDYILNLINEEKFGILLEELKAASPKNEILSEIKKKIYNYQDLKAYSKSDLRAILMIEINKLDLEEKQKDARIKSTYNSQRLALGSYERNIIFPIMRFAFGVIIAGISIATYIFASYWHTTPGVYANLFGLMVGILFMSSALWHIATPLIVVREDEIIINNSFLLAKKYIPVEKIDKIEFRNDLLKIRDKDFRPYLLPMFLFSRKDRNRLLSLR